MNRWRLPALLTALVLALTGLAGCGSSKPKGDVSTLSTTALLSKAKAKIESEKYVRVKGKITEQGSQTGLDLAYVGKDSHGLLTINNATVEIETVSGKTYFKPSDAFWKSQMGPSASAIIKLINGRWIIADSNNASFKELIDLASRKFVTDKILDPSSKVTKGSEKKVDGVTCVALNSGDGVLYLDKTDAKPIQIGGGGSNGGASGTADFSYDKIDSPKAPAEKDTIDVSKLAG